MSLIFILTLAVQAGLIVHVIKTGRNSLWIWAIALLPAAGSLAYVVVEIVPGAFGSPTAKRTKAGVQRIIDPDRDLRRAAAEVEISGNVDARRRLAAEHYDRGQFGEAVAGYQAGLKGIFEHDPTLLLGLAQAQFALHDFAAARASLERLIQHNPEFKSADGHLLYARTLEAENALDAAEHEYAAVAPGFPGAEARLRYGLLLKRRGKLDAARAIFKDLLDGAKLGPPHYRRAQAQWLDQARRELGLGMRAHAQIGWLCCAVVTVALASCGGQQEPARQQLSAIDAQLSMAAGEAAHYVPDQLVDVEAHLNDLKAASDRKDYAAVVRGAPAVMLAAHRLSAAAADQKAQSSQVLGLQWASLAAAVPADATVVAGRIEVLSRMPVKAAGAPPDLTAARSALRADTSLWSKAQAAFAAGNMNEAVQTAMAVKTQLESLATSLGVNP